MDIFVTNILQICVILCFAIMFMVIITKKIGGRTSIYQLLWTLLVLYAQHSKNKIYFSIL